MNLVTEFQIIMDKESEKVETTEQMVCRSLADEINFIAQDEQSPSEILVNLIYEDFVRCR